MSKQGFIGLGSQGGPMAQRMIDAGYEVVLWARRAETLEPYANTSALIAGSVEELAGEVEQVAVCVVDDAGVQNICEQLFPALRPGSRVVIHSTVHPDLCRKLAAQAADRQVALIDAPVSGGGHSAAEGTLKVMLGGSPEQVEKARPVFETFADLIVHLGDVGAGQEAKLVNNAMMAANLAVAHHGIEAAAALGIDRGAFVELVKVSSGRSFAFDVRARMPEPRAFSHGAKLLAKDVRLLCETLADNASSAAIEKTASSFLELALGEQTVEG